MAKPYTKEQLWKLYEKLPQEIKEAVFSNETAENIHSACANNEIKDENISRVAVLVGDVLLGILPPENFQETLKKELSLEKKMAEKIAQEINRLVFYPLKPSLEQLYQQKSASLKEKTAEESVPKEELKAPEKEKDEDYSFYSELRKKIEAERKTRPSSNFNANQGKEEVLEKETPAQPTRKDSYRELIE